jgi:hypothetical protein
MLHHTLAARLVAPFITRHGRWRTGAAAIAADQRRILDRLLGRLAPTRLGRELGLGAIRAAADPVAAFRRRVPLRLYPDHQALLERVWRGEPDSLFPGRAVALAQTSGTTSAGAGERFIPQSRDLLAHHRAGGLASLGRVLAATGPAPLAGRMLMLGGSTALEPNPHGIPTGDLSGIVVSLIPPWLAGSYEPGRDIALEPAWERKLARMTERCAARDIRLVSGIGSWQLRLFGEVCRARGVERIREAWPGLRAVIHGGHAIDPLVPRFAHHLDPATWMFEVYPASEAFIAMGSRPWRLDEGGPPDLELLTAHGIYLEFHPDDRAEDDIEATVGADRLEDGRMYRVVLTTPGGLVRYQPGDLALGCGPGRIRFGGRVRTRISVFGEHVEGHALAAALADACRSTGAEVEHYHVAPLLPGTGDGRGAHEWWIEFHRQPGDQAAFTTALDRHLCASVLDYAAHRAGDCQLRGPVLRPVPRGTFERWLAGNGGAGGQRKVPQAWNDRRIAEQLAQAAEA